MPVIRGIFKLILWTTRN